ncbi:MAG: transcriptional repressor NrdR [Clostridia bacterium]|nr:transcriptional repressor NrdR [Clostridia bacterium]MBP3422446.1 transcriptional repressor NrdR [Clostridia bacterium]
MKCLYCSCTESKVIDSRSADDDKAIRRRRECIGCGRRFTTYETIEVTPVLVVKNNGTRESFNAEKIRNGIIKSCEKRPVSVTEIDGIVADISKEVYNSMESEISTKAIGEMVMDRLKKVDEVAYVRYASVYRSFKDLSSFMAELKQMMKAEKKK